MKNKLPTFNEFIKEQWNSNFRINEKESQYTKKFHDKYGELDGEGSGKDAFIEEVAEKTHDNLGVNKSELKDALSEVYDRGLAAYQTSHRKGTQANQWAIARVYSFIVDGKTRQRADSDLAEEIGLE
jgi:hypothetical protein